MQMRETGQVLGSRAWWRLRETGESITYLKGEAKCQIQLMCAMQMQAHCGQL